MNVSLTEELEQWIEQRVRSGLYRSSSEVVREALRVLREREELKELRREQLRAQLRQGVADLDQGAFQTLSDDVAAAIKLEGRQRLKNR